MRGIIGFVSILIVAGVAFYLYSRQATSLSPTGAAVSPKASIDITGVQNDLMAMANAERRRFASDSKYVSIDDLISNGDIGMQSKQRGPYQYSSEISENGFRITATYSGGPAENIPQTISIDESMQIRRE